MPEGSGKLLEAIFASSPDAVIIVDDEGRIDLASAAVGPLFGYTPEELIGVPVETLVPDDVRRVHSRFRASYADAPSARPMGAGLALHGQRRDGSVFPVDVSLSPVSHDGRRLTAAFVRDATDRRRSEFLMGHVNEITRKVLAGDDRWAVLELICQRSLSLASATVTWVVLPDDNDHTQLRVVAAAGTGSEHILGATVDAASSLSARAMIAGRPVVVADMARDQSVIREARDLGFRPGVYFPMNTQDGPMGALVAARSPEREPFSDAEIDATEVFASAAAVGLALGEARDAMEDLRIVSEHERIARDLHDTVIQRLFALGMGLQGAQRLADGRVSERISDAVRAIDEVIREIRETIFDLNRPESAGLDVRQSVRGVVSEATGVLGLTPRVSFRGPVEAAVSDEVLPHLLAVLRESLSNVGRHARASRVDVVVVASSDNVSLSVADDGVGVPDGLAAGHGLPNMADRAGQLGGECTITRRRPSGTLLQWRVPTSARQPR